MADISVIKLPSGNEYNIKDAVARQAIAGGISFNIVWKQGDYESTTAPTATQLASIPQGVTVYYNNGASTATGTLVATEETTGFYLIYSKTQTSEGAFDKYDEYFAVATGDGQGYSWEKLGDTQIDLSGVVTNVTLNKSTDTVIGTDATFTVTQPTIAIETDSTSGTGKVQVATGISSASATGGGAAWNSKDSKTVVTGYASPSTDTFVKSVSAETNKNLVTTSITGVQSSTTTASKAAAGTNQTTAKGTGTTSTTNTDWLKGVSVTGEVLSIGAATMDTQTTTQFTFSDVTVPIKAASATTVATGATSTTGTGDAVVTGVTIGSSASAITALGTPSTATVVGTSATFTNTQPTISVTPSTTYIKGTASSGNVAWNSKDSVTVLTNGTSISVDKGE